MSVGRTDSWSVGSRSWYQCRCCVRDQGIPTWFSAPCPGEMLSCSFSVELRSLLVCWSSEMSVLFFVTLDGWWCWVRGWTQHAPSFWSTFVVASLALLHAADCWSTSVVCFMTTTVGLGSQDGLGTPGARFLWRVWRCKPVCVKRDLFLAFVAVFLRHPQTTRSPQTLCTCQSFWSWTTFCLRGKFRGMEQRWMR